MSLILFIIVVLVLLALALYACSLLPLPDPSGIVKPAIMILCVVLAIYVIGERAGVFH